MKCSEFFRNLQRCSALTRRHAKMKNEPTGGLGKLARGVSVLPAVKIPCSRDAKIVWRSPRMSENVRERHRKTRENAKRTQRRSG